MRRLLEDRTALVTGASSGIGRELARELAAHGASLVLAARRADRLEELAAELTAGGTSARIEPADLVDPQARAGLCGRLSRDGVRVDVLVNNAGTGSYGEFARTDWERLDRVIQLDATAVTHLTHLFLPGMLARGWGRILLVGSTGSFAPTPYYAAYAAAKSYVLSLGLALRRELAGTGVTCTTLCPGFTATEFFAAAREERLTRLQTMTMMASRDVARIGVQAMLAGRSYVVAGRVNAVTMWLTRFAPRTWAAAVAGRFVKAERD